MISRSGKLTLLCLVFTGVVPAYGQQTTANLSGTITDPSGAPVTGASVKLERVGQGVSRTAVSASDGRFSFTFVPPGPYRLTVSQTGFSDLIRTGLQLETGQDLDLPIQLVLKQLTESVEVSATAAALDTETAEQRGTVSVTQVNELPVAHEDWSNLLQLDSGTKKPTPPTFAASNTGGSGLVVNGLPPQGYIVTVDGTNASQNPEFNSWGFYQASNIINTVNNDSIEEVSIAKGVASAPVGNAMSGGINIVTKSGTNQYRGSVYELAEQTVFDARNQFLTSRPRTTFNEYGASFGGPIMKNKLFFFGGWEGAGLSTSKTISGAVPSPYLISIAPAAYQSLLALFPKAAQPASSATATTAQFIGAAKTKQTDSNGVYRLDYYINQNNIVAVRFVRARPYWLTPGLLPSNSRYYDLSQAAPNVSYTHSSANWTENTRFAYNKLVMIREDAGWPLDLPSWGFGFSTGGSQLLADHGSYTTLQEGVAFIHGKQSIQFGGIFERTADERVQEIAQSYGYSTLAGFLSDAPSSINLTYWQLPPGTPPPGDTEYQYGAYIQDAVKATKDVTLNLGLRYDLWTVPVSYNGQAYNRGVDSQFPQLGSGFGPFRPADSYYDGNHKNFQPRVGVAYNLSGRGTTVIRGGFGIMTTARPLIAGPLIGFQLSAALPNSVGLNAALVKAAGLNYPLPYSPTYYAPEVALLQSQGILSQNLATAYATGTQGVNPYSIQYTFGVQQALGRGLTLEVNYNGNRGLHETMFYTNNLPNRTTGVSPKPNFGTFSVWTPIDRSKYAGLQTMVRKRLERGLTFSGSLTWSRATSYGDADLLTTTPFQQNYGQPGAEWARAPFDVALRFVGSAIWELPLTKWMHVTNKSAGAVLGGWQLSGIYSAQGGLPANVTNTASSYASDRPDAAGTSPYVTGYQTGIHQYLNAAAFVPIPISSLSGAQVRPGNLGRDAITTPGVENLDASLAKSFAFRERFRMQLRADTFNTLNHTNLSGLVVTINTPATFGQLTQATARTMQVGARLTF